MSHKLIVIGASTGGPSQIKEILSSLHSLSYTLVIVQHMKEEVLPFYIKDLEETLDVSVESTPCIISKKPSVIVCSQSCVVVKKYANFELVTQTMGQYYTPDINKLLHSFIPYTREFDLEVIIMTGIGRDGVDSAKKLKKLDVKVIAQDEKSSPVYGMPKAAYESKIVDEVKSLDEIKHYLGSI